MNICYIIPCIHTHTHTKGCFLKIAQKHPLVLFLCISRSDCEERPSRCPFYFYVCVSKNLIFFVGGGLYCIRYDLREIGQLSRLFSVLNLDGFLRVVDRVLADQSLASAANDEDPVLRDRCNSIQFISPRFLILFFFQILQHH